MSARPVMITTHIEDDVLKRCWKSEPRARIRDRIRLVWLVQSKGLSAKAAGRTMGMSQSWTSRWTMAYNLGGLEALEGLQQGQRPNLKVPDNNRKELAALFEKDPPQIVNGGIWDGPKVAAVVAALWDITITRQTGWSLLREAGFTPQTRRPKHVRTTDEQRQTFKKNAT